MHTRTPRLAEQRREQGRFSRYYFLALCVVGGGLVCASLYFLFFSRLTTIEFIDVSASDGVDASSIRSAVFDQMKERRYVLFSQKNIFFLSANQLEKNLKKRFVIDSFSLKRKPPHTLSLSVTGKPFRLLWVAGDAVWDVASDGTLFRRVDAHAPIALSILASLQTAQENKGQKIEKRRYDIPVVYDQAATPRNSGDSVMSADVLEFILSASRLLNDGNFHPVHFEITPDTPTITVVMAEGWSILFNILNDPEKQYHNVKQVIANYYKQNTQGLHYIDARFDNRMYAK